jgi:FMN phosphatase YigB (HAD superfamily)
LEGQSEFVRHLVATDAFRELDDRRLASPRAYAVPGDRSSLGCARHGARRNRAHDGRGPARLQTKYKLVVLSNGDPDMLETAKSYHKVPFDRVISVAEANSFKPHVATYTKAAELIGLPVDQILFVANHVFDCIGAKSAGMRTAFIDRRSRPFGVTPHQPDILVPSMKDLADAIV